MNDKPQVQFKLGISDTDTLRDMIKRDHKETVDMIEIRQDEMKLLADGPERTDLRQHFSELQRQLMGIERLAEIFSVTLPRR